MLSLLDALHKLIIILKLKSKKKPRLIITHCRGTNRSQDELFLDVLPRKLALLILHVCDVVGRGVENKEKAGGGGGASIT